MVPYSYMCRRATIAKSATRVVPITASNGLPSLAMCSTAALRSAAVYPAPDPAAAVGITTTSASPLATASAARPTPAAWLAAPTPVLAWNRSG